MTTVAQQLIAKVESLLADISTMQDVTDKDWYGAFSEGQFHEDGHTIEWPNLTISAAEATVALDEFKKAQADV